MILKGDSSGMERQTNAATSVELRRRCLRQKLKGCTGRSVRSDPNRGSDKVMKARRIIRGTCIVVVCLGGVAFLVLSAGILFANWSGAAGDDALSAQRFFVVAGIDEHYGLSVRAMWRTPWRPLTHTDEAEERYRFLSLPRGHSARDKKPNLKRRAFASALGTGEFATWRDFNIRNVRDGAERYEPATWEAEYRFLAFHTSCSLGALGSMAIALLLMAYPSAVFLLGPLRRLRRCANGRCAQCNYDLRGMVSPKGKALRERARDRASRSWRRISKHAAIAAGTGAVYAMVAPIAVAALHGWFPNLAPMHEFSALTGHLLPADRFYPDRLFLIRCANVVLFAALGGAAAWLVGILRSPWSAALMRTAASHAETDARCPECGRLIPVVNEP